MVIKQFFFTVIFILFSFQCGIGKALQTEGDIRPQWKVYEGNKLTDFSRQPTKSIHFSLDLAHAKCRYLQIESRAVFYLFINTTFIARNRALYLSVDSLKQKYSAVIFVSIYQPEGIGNLETTWVSPLANNQLLSLKRPSQAFSNFILVASLILTIFFTALFRTNPQLTLDYLDFPKLFFFRDREESQITLRITSSVNLLFYLFCSLLTSLALITASHYSQDRLSFLRRSASSTTGEDIAQWIFLAFAILGLLMAKLAFGVLLALLYNWREVAGFQFFNFIRVLILSLSLIAVVSIFCFSLNINVPYFNLLELGCLLLAMGVGLLYFKLLTRTSFRSFHLFSYLCASEIFPLMILIKVLLF